FSDSDQLRNLPIINLMNSLSVAIVLMVAWPIARIANDRGPALPLSTILGYLQSFRLIALVSSTVILLLVYATFPSPDNLILRGVLEKMRLVPLLAVLLGFATWNKLPMGEKVFIVLIQIVAVFLGL